MAGVRMPDLNKALIIDDEVDICLLLKNVLKKLGIHTKYALSLEEAKNKAKSYIPDLVLLDLNLPDGSGFDIISYLKKINPAVKVIIQTAYDEHENKLKAARYGVEHFLTKPIDISMLRNALLV